MASTSSESEVDSSESVAVRLSRLTQLLAGRITHPPLQAPVSRDGLLDALLVLFDECNTEHLMKNQYIASFVKKYTSTVTTLRKLRININDFEVKNTIGRGHFGEVQVVREKSTGDVYALKVLRKADTLAQQNVAFYEEERDIMAKTISEWITKMQYAFQDPSHLYLVMEFHPGGDLLSLLARYDDMFEESFARFYLAEMVLAVHALHTMGYVHRDVKPENILLDRTGHVKLADFGSACRLADANSSTSNMPVGTPDYICPEVLTKMNSDQVYGKFSEECDWWSLGVCAYEMMFGKTPFTDAKGSMVVTYANIMNFKKCLKFPESTEVSEAALSLIQKLLTDAATRLKYEAICTQPFFNTIDFNNIRHTKPPFIPTITSNDDTSNFDEFDRARPSPTVQDFKMKTHFSGKDLPFIGFTFTKGFDCKEKPSLTQEVSSPAAKNSLERRLAQKSRELQEVREKCKSLEHKESNASVDLGRLKVDHEERLKQLHRAEEERETLERDTVHHITEINSLKRLLEMEREERKNIDSKVLAAIRDITDKSEKKIQLAEENLSVEREELYAVVDQLQEEKLTLTKTIEGYERDMRRKDDFLAEKDKKIQHLQSRVKTAQANNKVNTDELEAELSFQERDYLTKEAELKRRLEEAVTQNQNATELLKEVRQSKLALEDQLNESRTECQQKDQLQRKLGDSEEKRKSLEVQVHRISLIEKREEVLKEELKEKSCHVTQLAERIGELEQMLHSKELEFKKCEKLYSQREDQLKDKIRELEETLETVQAEHGSLEEQSLLIFEANEERLAKLQEQESTITLLRSNVNLLEMQIEEMRDSLQTVRVKSRRSTSRSRSTNMLGTAGQASPSTPKLPRPRQSGFTQTDWVSPRRGSAKKNLKELDALQERSRLSGCTQTDWVSPRRGSGKRSSKVLVDRSRLSGFTQTDDYSPASMSDAQTSPISGDQKLDNAAQTASPMLSSNQTQTDVVRRMSGGCQTEQRTSSSCQADVKRRSKRSTEVVVSVMINNHADTSGNSDKSSDSVTADQAGLAPVDEEMSGDPLNAAFNEQDSDRMTDGHTDDEWESASCAAGTEDGEVEDEDWEEDDEDAESQVDEDASECDSQYDEQTEEESDLNEGAETDEDSERKERNALPDNDTLESQESPNVTVILNPEASSLAEDTPTAAAGGQQEAVAADTSMRGTRRASRRSSHSKESSRKSQEKISDLHQEKMYLELRVETLQRELTQVKESVHEQRIRALDYKHELREKSGHLEVLVKELKEKLNAAELSLSDAKETASNSQEKEAASKIRADKLQQQLEESQTEARQKITKLQVERDDLDTQVRLLQNKVSNLEGADEDLDEATQKILELSPKLKDVEERLRQALEEKARFKLEADLARGQISEKTRQCEVLEQRVAQLKSLCSELENQVQDFEALNEAYEQKQKEWNEDRNTYVTAVDERENEIDATSRHLASEKQLRHQAEDGKKELARKLRSLQETTQAEHVALKLKLEKERDKVQLLNSQLTDSEKHGSLVEIDKKSLRRQLDAVNEDNLRLKEERSELITKLSELKASNLKLSKNLEEAMDRYELLANQKTDLENQLESVEVDHKHDRYKLGATLNQQTKLIDYLQGQVEHPPKKKKGLFGRRGENSVAITIQHREVQHSLEHERDKNSTLRLQIAKLKDDLNQAKTETLRLKSNSLDPRLVQNLVLSPCNHAPSPGGMSTATSGYGSQMGTPKMRPKKERMKHNIPHRFLTGLNSRPTKCAVCLGSIHFVKQAAKCQECSVVCHPKCAPSLPATCGLPTEYAVHFASILDQAKSISTTRLSTADLRLQMTGWIKVPRPGKQLWEKKWAVLQENMLKVYDDESLETEYMDAFELCPTNGSTSVHSAVTAAELTSTASSDLPYILRLEFEPDTTCWPGRSLYLMALTFPEKQRWVGTLEAIVDHSGTNPKRQDARLLGNTLLSLSGDQRLETNCSLPLSKKVALLGADEGLYIMDLTKNKNHYVAQVGGVDSVHQMASLAGLDVIVMITGKERQVVVADVKAAERCATYQATTALTLRNVPDASACTTFVLGMTPSGIFLCAALAEKILILKYNPSQGNFVLKKEMLTSTVCSCMYFGEKFVVVGTDKFFKIDLHHFTMTDFLSKQDTSLAFATFGAAHFDSFPIAVLQMAPVGEPEEFLLCYHEFGVFVDASGHRSREDDMKWATLPLNFVYREPYLYVVHFNAIQVVEIPPVEGEGYDQMTKTILNVPGPRYLGNALSPEAIYIGSFHDNECEVICFKGNLVNCEAGKENDGTRASVRKKGRRILMETQVKYAETDQNDVFQSPPPIRNLQHSPSSSKMTESDSETTSTATSDTASLSSY